jgi:hypothetical protein
MRLNKYLEYYINISDDNAKELDNMCDLKWIHIDKKKLKYTSFIYNLLYPCINTFHYVKNISKYKYDISYLKKLIDNPFLHPVYQNSCQNYSYYLKNKTNNIYESKIFWNNFFIKYDANTPEIKAIIINGNIITNYSGILELLEHNKNKPTELLNTIVANHNNGDIVNKDVENYDTMFKNSIIKPNYGCRGNGIYLYSRDSIPTKEGIFLIQEKVINKKYNGHFRIVTHYDKENNTHKILYTYLCIQEDNTKIVSNVGRITIYEVNNDSVRRLIEKKHKFNLQKFDYSYSLLTTALNKAVELHKKLNAIMIGWDVKLTDENYYFLEGNYGPGNIFFSDYYYLDKLDLVSKIKYD